MGIFDRFRQKPSEPSSSDGQSRAQDSQTFYEMAYFMLPQILYADASRVIRYFAEEAVVSAGAFLYVMCCKAKNAEPSEAIVPQFRQHTGVLLEGYRYYLIQYPSPTPDPAQFGAGMVLAPYFSAIIVAEATGAIAYFILGQRPMGGTTVRTVSSDGTNANLGEGPVPEVDAFLGVLRQRIQT